MTLKLQEGANLGIFFHVMQTIHFIYVFVYAFLNRVYEEDILDLELCDGAI